MRHVRRVLFTALLCLLAASPSFSAIVYVAPSGKDTNKGDTWATAKATVGAGLAAATSGDQVWVETGTYHERVTVPVGVSLYGGFAGTETVLDQRDPAKNPTTLNGDAGGTVVTVASGATSSTVIDSLTITNGRATGNGGGIDCLNSAPSISNNDIDNNVATGNGGGVFMAPTFATSVTIFENDIRNNMASGFGGGLYLSSSGGMASIANNVLDSNTAPNVSALQVIEAGGTPTFNIEDNTILANSTNQTFPGAAAQINTPTTALSGTVFFEGNSIANNNGIGLEIDGSLVAGATIGVDANTFSSNGFTALDMSSIAPFDSLSSISVTNNEFSGSGTPTTRGTPQAVTIVINPSGSTPAMNVAVTDNVTNGLGMNIAIQAAATGSPLLVARNSIQGGGGLALTGPASGTAPERVADNVIVNNSSGISLVGVTGAVVNDTIVNNAGVGIAVSGAATSVVIGNDIVVSNGSGISSATSNPQVFLSHNDVFLNAEAPYENVTPDPTSISADPQLNSVFAPNLGSPVIDAGDDSLVLPGETDRFGSVRFAGAHVDIGAIEALTASPPMILSLAPGVVKGGTPTQGKVILPTAPTTDEALTLSTTPGASVPATVTVHAGATTATFTVSTLASLAGTTSTISATDGTNTGTDILGIDPSPGTQFAGGIQFFSVPFGYTQSPADVFGLSSLNLYVWSQSTLSYLSTPTAPADSLHLGQAYWTRFVSTTELAFQGQPADTTQNVTIPLQEGWNQVGDPFATSVPLTSLTFNNGTETFTQATTSVPPLIGGTFWTYNGGPTYTAAQELDPGAGYWVFAAAATNMTVPHP